MNRKYFREISWTGIKKYASLRSRLHMYASGLINFSPVLRPSNLKWGLTINSLNCFKLRINLLESSVFSRKKYLDKNCPWHGEHSSIAPIEVKRFSASLNSSLSTTLNPRAIRFSRYWVLTNIVGDWNYVPFYTLDDELVSCTQSSRNVFSLPAIWITFNDCVGCLPIVVPRITRIRWSALARWLLCPVHVPGSAFAEIFLTLARPRVPRFWG